MTAETVPAFVWRGISLLDADLLTYRHGNEADLLPGVPRARERRRLTKQRGRDAHQDTATSPTTRTKGNSE